jgi:hypothetical protein
MNKDLNIGDIIVVTDAINKNVACTGDISILKEIDGSYAPYKVSNPSYSLTASWCKQVRAATKTEKIAYEKGIYNIFRIPDDWYTEDKIVYSIY